MLLQDILLIGREAVIALWVSLYVLQKKHGSPGLLAVLEELYHTGDALVEHIILDEEGHQLPPELIDLLYLKNCPRFTIRALQVVPIAITVEDDYRQAAVSLNLTITPVTEFIIFGFPSLQKYQLLLFCVFLFIYLFTITGNGSIFLLVALDHHLHTPMYVFVGNLSFLDLSYATVTIPKMLAKFSINHDTISYTACLAQMYIFLSLGSTECLLLTSMAYDRYVAICSPLYYHTIMTQRWYILLMAMTWSGGFLTPFASLILVLKLPFCGPNIIHHYYCDHPPLLQLACADTSFNVTVGSSIAGLLILITFILVVVSYIKIVLTILKMNSKEGRMKTFSTCGSHFAVVNIFYLPLIFMYVRPKASYSSDVDSLVALLYTVLTPMMNPVIYSLRNKDIIEAFKKKIHFVTKE
ncbi:olfactory receptor 6N1-like [Dendropsophus ebraccatus]|uniref:olfactory receptor 6N1-like n=1 Tax=Dendropsophus ebraccatus TaxID=150705 RepID=UPI00383172AA